MKQLTKEQQEQAVELIKGLMQKNPMDNYIESAKAFLQSLKPKIYVCKIDEKEKIEYLQGFYANNIFLPQWNTSIGTAKQFNLFEEARELLNSIEKDDNFKYFILTE